MIENGLTPKLMDSPTIKQKAAIKSGANLPPLGEPPEALTGDQLKAWYLIDSNCYPGILCEPDRLAVESAAMLCVKVKNNKACVTDKKQLKNLLSKFCINAQSMTAFGI
jgi:hypothetical protein